MASNFIQRYKINNDHFVNAIDVMLKIDFIMPFEAFTNNKTETISNENKIWQIVLELLYDYFNGTVTNETKSTIHWTQENASKNNGKYKVSSKDICDNLSENDKNILSQYNMFDNKLYKISKLIAEVDSDFVLLAEEYNYL